MSGDPGYFTTLVTLNPSTGAFITLVGTRLARVIEIIEDGSANDGQGQGLIFMEPDPRSTPDNPLWLPAETIEPSSEPIVLGNKWAIHQPFGAPISNGPGVTLGLGTTLGTNFLQIKSATPLSTIVRVREYS